ncbi:undecaprenyldiphospho-muramoylpentapeptide beta-N-acetylglucosaminyltransferase [Agathobaculum sp. NSJ-28]|uniref:UDP-N-acetylglucosamine--N-acetylmuramyl-(pentapeptide) pyrophosphoryl-undecaprenol N-acetylglucosamine transferase n=2 Tax=Agathobaculum TaxID=2048137 RepID=A0A923RVM2_9FIRM|nr:MULTISPECIES: undecaprenyldiphospho-muramoylpentapeptide beta-N-acetylglucosaminyltransferase [Butyricicoccaceae]MBC5725172.1 undecaprenyldiphospho-muramoylpentapeptide beta-N-acetylglucosaminyltransferase [Agathobaculum faecis]MCU6789624.1 undecaprenyldiphospho-muramoylpentapeptide beta-N-acetylglucosaminyltransferase [Agathobaculum ammoniilyticum]WOC74456.1 undecaprenyldiphospho-muramoylpentapeptide beta-N-acetylglucosaminyltransferase [Intestinibacillus sp. NTUH-41-i26]SCJ30185.1 UDP-N-ac
MKLYITGGGTGGHVTPGLAIARYFEQKHPDTVVRFAGSARGIENKLVPREGYPLDTIEIIGLSRSMSPKGLAHNLKAARLAVSAVGKAKKLLREARPDCVIGCGGYASFAVVRAAQQMGIPTVLLEVNALPGKVTQMLAKKADRVLVCFEQAEMLLGGGDKVVVTGAPVRGEILSADRKKARARFGLSEDDQLVVSFWGSMGAKYMNEHMAGTIALECKNNVPYRHVHASGAAARDWMPRLAEEQGAALREHPNIELTEYIYDMADRMAAADLIVCRAGAATMGELCMLGRPALLVPSPFVAENHQEKNARALEQAGGCRVLLEKDASPQRLYDEIGELLSDRERLRQMGRDATRLAAHDASEKIYREIMQAVRERQK